ncbi:MAG TPA: dihydrofolate reductase family protein, partial [Flavipsychrobacter sp.]|nr:dihydrofolate reductase family protein [Flavipsychrobacter sp.]
IITFGSPGIVSQLSQYGLIDEYHFIVQPIIAGGGKHFFETNQLDKAFNIQLTGTKMFKSGAIGLYYKIAH